MGRLISRSSQTVIDLGVLSLAFWLAFMLRFDWELPMQMLKRAAFTWPYVVLFQYGVMWLWGVPRLSWRYVSLRESLRIAYALGSASLVLLLARLLSVEISRAPGFAAYAIYAMIPIGVILINLIIAYLAITGVRVLRRMQGERITSAKHLQAYASSKRIMLVGAGEAGVMVAKEITARPDLGLRAVGFVDDDPVKKGTVIHGVPVLGSTRELAELCIEREAVEVLISIANAPGREIRRIKELCDAAGLPAKIIPGLYEIVGGQVNLQRIRAVAISDLLGREPVQLDAAAIGAFIQRKVVLITGAGGSIGSELCRQVARFTPARLILVERFENALFEIHSELLRSYQNLELLPRVADITDSGRMGGLFAEYKPDVVIHAAAHKHVPMMEWNPGEAIKNNVLGTQRLADLAAAHAVGHFVMISTDKAVNPTSVMGASKRVAELYVQGMAQQHRDTRFVAVRFGNVLGSAGSVIPIFKRQIEAGGPVTVTHPDMRRYFMTIPEASQLVLQAATQGQGGEVFILDMGEPVKIVDLARDLIRLSGFEPEQEIEIRFSGLRPGEKLFEELATDAERADKTQHSKIFVGHVEPADWQSLRAGIESLSHSADAADERAVYAGLRALIPEFSGQPSDARVIPLADARVDKKR